MGRKRTMRRGKVSASIQSTQSAKPLSMRGSFSQVIKPLSEKVVTPFLKSWQYWGKVTCDFERIRKDGDLVGFIIDVNTSRGSYRYTFKKEVDPDGYYKWTQVKVEEKI